jgi:hypothetical protein
MATETRALPAFTLRGLDGEQRSFPGERHALLVFADEHCPTSNLVMPLVQAAHEAFGNEVDVWVVGQEAGGNRTLAERHRLSLPLLDDSALRVSYAYEVETVPTIVFSDPRGYQLDRYEGFVRDDWDHLFEDLGSIAGVSPPEVDWSEYPDSRPGCGSRSVEPENYERLRAEFEGETLRARRIELGAQDDVFEFMFDQGLTDGLPVVPPTPERVLRMLEGTSRRADEEVAVVPPNLAPVTVEKIAINAVMPGCRPEYLPVVIAAVEAMCTDLFNIHGVSATTMGATPVVIVNGPIRQRIGLNMGLGALGAGHRANASIGRAIRLVLRNVGGGRPGGTERSTLSNAMKYTACFAEWEERSPWPPFHVERGYSPEDSVVTVFAATGESLMVDQTSRTGRELGGSFGLKLEAVHHPKGHGTGDTLVVVSPEHADTLSRDGWSKDDLRKRIQEVTARPVRELLRDAESGAGMDPARAGDDLDRRIPKFRAPEYIHLVVAGSEAGKFSMIYDGWASAPVGSAPVSVRIEG